MCNASKVARSFLLQQLEALAWTLLSNWLYRKIKDWSGSWVWGSVEKKNKIILYIEPNPGIITSARMKQQLPCLTCLYTSIRYWWKISLLPFQQFYATDTIFKSIYRCRNKGKVIGPPKYVWWRWTDILNHNATLDFMRFENDLSKENLLASFLVRIFWVIVMFYLLYPLEFKNTSEIIKFWWLVNTKVWVGYQKSSKC